MADNEVRIKIKIDSNTQELIVTRKEFEKLGTTAQTAESYTDKFNKRIANMAHAVTAIYATKQAFDALISPIKQITTVSAEFERQKSILKTLEGDSLKAEKSFEWIKTFATDTPYQINNVAEAFVKAKAYGIDPVNGTLKTLGDTASAMGKDINQAVEAMADAMVGENERLKEFGIRAAVNGDKIAYDWMSASGKAKHVIIQNNSDIIQSTLNSIFNSKYEGAMGDQMNTFNGLVSNMQDQYTNFLNDIGTSSGVFDGVKIAIKDTAKEFESLTNNDEKMLQLGLVTKDAFLLIARAGQTVSMVVTGWMYIFETVDTIIDQVANNAVYAFLNIKRAWAETVFEFANSANAVLPDFMLEKLGVSDADVKELERNLLTANKALIEQEIIIKNRLNEHYDYADGLNLVNETISKSINSLDNYNIAIDKNTKVKDKNKNSDFGNDGQSNSSGAATAASAKKVVDELKKAKSEIAQLTMTEYEKSLSSINEKLINWSKAGINNNEVLRAQGILLNELNAKTQIETTKEDLSYYERKIQLQNNSLEKEIELANIAYANAFLNIESSNKTIEQKEKLISLETELYNLSITKAQNENAIKLIEEDGNDFESMINYQLSLIDATNEWGNSLDGVVGKIGNLSGSFANMAKVNLIAAKETRLVEDAWATAKIKYNEDSIDYKKAEDKYNKNSMKIKEKAFESEIEGMGSVFGSLDGFLKKGSKVQKIAHNTYVGFKAIEMGLSMQQLVAELSNESMKTAATTTRVGTELGLETTKAEIVTGLVAADLTQHTTKETAKAGISGVAAIISSMVGLPFPLNMLAMGATAAVIGTLLSSIGGSGGGGGAASSPYSTAELANAKVTELDDQTAIDLMQQQVDLLEAIEKNGSAQKLSVNLAAAEFTQAKNEWVQDIFDQSRMGWVNAMFNESSDTWKAIRQHYEDLGTINPYEMADGNIKLNSELIRNNVDDFITIVGEMATFVRGGEGFNYSGPLNQKLMSEYGFSAEGHDATLAQIRASFSELQGYLNDWAISVVDSVSELKDSSESMKEFYDDITGTDFYANQKLLESFSNFDKLLSGGESYSDYLVKNINQIEDSTKFIYELSGILDEKGKELTNYELLLSKNGDLIEEQMLKVAAFGEVTEKAFEGGVEEAINYMDSIEAVAEAMASSRENIKDWLDSFKTDEQILKDDTKALSANFIAKDIDKLNEYISTFYQIGLGKDGDSEGINYWKNEVETGRLAIEDLYSAMTTASAAYGSNVSLFATNIAELSNLFDLMSSDIDGLTDAELEFLQSNKELIDNTASTIEETFDSLVSNLDNLQSALDSVNSSISKYLNRDVTFYDVDRKLNSGVTADNYSEITALIDSAYNYEKTLINEKFALEKTNLTKQLNAVKSLEDFADNLSRDNSTQLTQYQNSEKYLNNSIASFKTALDQGLDTSSIISNIQAYTNDYIQYSKLTATNDAEYNYSVGVLQNRLKNVSVNTDIDNKTLSEQLQTKLDENEVALTDSIDFLNLMTVGKLTIVRDALEVQANDTIDKMQEQSDLLNNLLGANNPTSLELAQKLEDENLQMQDYLDDKVNLELSDLNLGILEQSDLLENLLGSDNYTVGSVNNLKDALLDNTDIVSAIDSIPIADFTDVTEAINNIPEVEFTDITDAINNIPKVEFTDITDAINNIPKVDFKDVTDAIFSIPKLDNTNVVDAVNNIPPVDFTDVNNSLEGVDDNLTNSIDFLAANNNSSSLNISARIISLTSVLSSSTTILQNTIFQTTISQTATLNNSLTTINTTLLSKFAELKTTIYDANPVNALINDFYENALGKTADDAGFDYWRNQLTSNKLNVEDLYQAMLNASIERNANINYNYLKDYGLNSSSTTTTTTDNSDVIAKLQEIITKLGNIETIDKNTLEQLKKEARQA